MTKASTPQVRYSGTPMISSPTTSRTILGVIPPALIALLDGGVGPAVAVVVVYTVINIVVQTIIQPRFTGDAVGISAAVAFLSLIVWASILGTLGALLAIPATLFVKSLLLDNSVPASWVNALVTSSPTDPPPSASEHLTPRRRPSTPTTPDVARRPSAGSMPGLSRRRRRPLELPGRIMAS